MLVAEGSTKGNIKKLTGMVQDAHQNKMVVHPYTVRADQLPDYATERQSVVRHPV